MKYRLLVVMIVLLAGCVSPLTPNETNRTTATTNEPTETQSQTRVAKGSIRAVVVDAPPANATIVSFDNETLQTETYRIVRSVVAEAVQDDSGFAQQDLYGEEVENTVGAMEAFPYYESSGRAGIYIEKNDTVVEVLAYRED